MKTYAVEIIGKTPLLMHHDNIEWADYMDTWKNDPGNKKTSKAGDDRSPAWRWLGCCYHDGKRLAIPQANIMRAIMEIYPSEPTCTSASQLSSACACSERLTSTSRHNITPEISRRRSALIDLLCINS